MHYLRNVLIGTMCLTATALSAGTEFTIADLSHTTSFLSDDGSEIRPMPSINGVESVHCLLPKNGVIQASRHRTVSQIWYVLAGTGDLWLKSASGKETLHSLKSGIAMTVPLGYAFQFRNTGEQNLEIFIVNATKWSGAGELIPVKNHWPVSGSKAP